MSGFKISVSVSMGSGRAWFPGDQEGKQHRTAENPEDPMVRQKHRSQGDEDAAENEASTRETVAKW